ncbi:pentraxin fusion protein-like [Pyxicephalus adspersus]|uniref:pentraxin fusion protein-like n=1 Tax=Pyxicephalus adspersus TaxID=30357 RepID=UPI003B595EA7
MNSDANLAKQAIDGVKDLNYYNGYCSHTLKEYSPWWKLDLKMKYKINYVEISGRSDCSFCFERLKCAEIRIGDNSDNNNPVCDVITNTSVATTSYCCYGMEGQFLSIVIPNHTEFLTLCEVEVYGDPVTL